MEPANPLHAEIRRHVREVQRTRRATNRMPADALVIRDGLMLKTRFSQSLTAFRAVLEKKAMALLYKLEKMTVELAGLSRQILALTNEFQQRWLPKLT